MQLLLGLGVQILGAHDIDLVNDDKNELVGKERLDRGKELHLGLDRVSTLLRQIHKVKNGRTQMGNGGNRLHFNCVHLFKRMVQDTGSVDGLKSQHLVVKVTDEQTLGGEGVWLNVDVGTRNVLEETRLSDVGVTADEECSGVRIDGWETTKMLSDLFEVEKRILHALADGGHATESGSLELLALEERLTILEQTNVISGDGLNQMLGRRQLTESNSEVVGIVERVEQILVERVDVGETRESVEDGCELLDESL